MGRIFSSIFFPAKFSKRRERGVPVLRMSVSGMELQCSASVDQMMSTVIENNLFNLSFTSTQAAYCEISPQHFESSDTPQEEPLAEEMKPESRQWERKLVRMVSGPYLYSTVNFDFRKFRALTFSSLY